MEKLSYFDLMYESYVNGNRNDHRERYFKMQGERQLRYILYLLEFLPKYEIAGIVENLLA